MFQSFGVHSNHTGTGAMLHLYRNGSAMAWTEPTFYPKAHRVFQPLLIAMRFPEAKRIASPFPMLALVSVTVGSFLLNLA